MDLMKFIPTQLILIKNMDYHLEYFKLRNSLELKSIRKIRTLIIMISIQNNNLHRGFCSIRFFISFFKELCSKLFHLKLLNFAKKSNFKFLLNQYLI